MADRSRRKTKSKTDAAAARRKRRAKSMSAAMHLPPDSGRTKTSVQKDGNGAGNGAPVRGVRNPLAGLRGEIDRLFDDFSANLPRLPFGRRDLEPFRRFQTSLGVAAPAIDLVEKENEFELTAELPGMEERDIELFVAGGVLTIRGQKREQREERRADYYVSERRYGSFQRSFQLPEDADVEQIAASFRRGVLTITLPKAPKVKRQQRKIAIRAR
jgi:HSP20 family protein